jgi:ZIP family zinc transporter
MSLQAGLDSATLLPVLGATALTWLATAAGASLVWWTPRLSPRWFSGLLGLAAVVMLVAAIGGLALPAWEVFSSTGWPALPATSVGVLTGVLLAHLSRQALDARGGGARLGRRLFAVMSFHHVPEGLAVGLAVSAGMTGDATAGAAAVLVVVAMAGHNVLEGALVSLPLRQEGASRGRAFLFGQASGIAEIAGAILGAGAVAFSSALLPWGLAAAAGAMVTVTVVDLLPAMRLHWRAAAAG